MQLFLDNKTDTHNQTLIIQWIYSNNENNRRQEKYRVYHSLKYWAALWNSSRKFEIDQTQNGHIRAVKYFHDSCNDTCNDNKFNFLESIINSIAINSILNRFLSVNEVK